MITHFLYVFQYVEENEMEVIMVRSFAVHGKIFKERCFFFFFKSYDQLLSKAVVAVRNIYLKRMSGFE